MKPGLKKLRSCTFSKEMVTKDFFSRHDQYNRKLVCDHPKIRENWTEPVCINCLSYLNRNKPTEPEPKTPTRNKKKPSKIKKI